MDFYWRVFIDGLLLTGFLIIYCLLLIDLLFLTDYLLTLYLLTCFLLTRYYLSECCVLSDYDGLSLTDNSFFRVPEGERIFRGVVEDSGSPTDMAYCGCNHVLLAGVRCQCGGVSDVCNFMLGESYYEYHASYVAYKSIWFSWRDVSVATLSVSSLTSFIFLKKEMHKTLESITGW